MDRDEQQARQARREYMRSYMRLYRSREENKEKLRQQQMDYWKRKSQAVECRSLEVYEQELQRLRTIGNA